MILIEHIDDGIRGRLSDTGEVLDGREKLERLGVIETFEKKGLDGLELRFNGPYLWATTTESVSPTTNFDWDPTVHPRNPENSQVIQDAGTVAEIADVLEDELGALEMREAAKEAGVKRSPGENKRETAKKIAEQNPDFVKATFTGGD